jgi:lipopolysaccharide/colanic/teichoic acid biosynthesis glycosyltransferase/glycosyltransferase involved in cell wall biosynthesis
MISVIVPAKDAEKTIGECLQALLHQEGFQYGDDYEVIVVDDGSSDGTAAIAENFNVNVLQQTNRGPSAARNTGARNARGTILAFTDADCTPSSNWLSALTCRFENPEIVGVKGTYRTDQTAPIPRFVQFEYEYKYSHMQKQSYIDFVDTYSAAYRKDIFLLNGGFDETFPLPSVEDQEFSFRLARKGYRMVFEHAAVVFHHHDLNLSQYLRRKFGIGYWKAVMLRWIPEKTFTDSHTAPTQRIEIILLALMMAAIAFGAAQLFYASILFLIFLALFLLVLSPFLVFIQKRDPQILWVAPAMLLFRAAALGMGLVKGILLPPKSGFKGYPCTSMHTRFLKRVTDIVGGCIGLVLFSPLIFVAAIAISIDSRGPVFYRQARAGENGKPFTIIKLRTMVVGADEMVNTVIQKNKLFGPAFKIPSDPRVTRIGQILRRWSLDEAPQFWNVLRGDMSLVGPRPEELRIVAMYNDYQRQRLMVKPGITGPMQVNGRGGLDFDTRLQLEMDYLKNYSILSDVKIMIRTIPVVLSGEGIS